MVTVVTARNHSENFSRIGKLDLLVKVLEVHQQCIAVKPIDVILIVLAQIDSSIHRVDVLPPTWLGPASLSVYRVIIHVVDLPPR